MTDWRTAMRDAGGPDEQNEFSPADAETMRRLVIAAAGQPAESPARASWRRPMFVVATVAAVIAVGTVATIKMDLSERTNSTMTVGSEAMPATETDRTTQSTSADAPNRQLQFLTPGGTRIIWVFNSDLNLKATTR